MASTDSSGSDPTQRPSVSCLISADRLAQRVSELAGQVSADYDGKDLLLIGVLKGAWVFLADLVRQLRIPVRCDFVRVTSYGLGTETSGDPRLLLDCTESVTGAHVLVVEDIIDTGVSTAWLLEHLRRKEPASLRVCAMLSKPSQRQVTVDVDYLGFEIPDRFVVGYGLDCGERFRELPYVGWVTSDERSEES
jgi:hypoxanthine phosphoribosyltransferase